MSQLLHDGWTLRPDGGPVPAHVRDAGPVPATVPGTVHTDLLAAGLVPDPYLDDNERLLAWIGLTDWVYETTVTLGPVDGDRRTLLFHGLDTVATVSVDGQVVLEAADQHRTHVLDVTDVLGEGEHRLQVRFASAVRYADAQQQALGSRPHVNHHPYNAVRKMACNFGWDWGPDLVTAGIWRRVELVDWSVARIAGVRPTTTLTRGRRAPGGGRRPGAGRLRAGRRDRARHRPAASTPTRAPRCRSGPTTSAWPSTSPARARGGPAATATSRCPTSPSTSWSATRSCRPGPGGSASARSPGSASRTSTARRSGSSSTGSRCSCAGSTGSPTTPSRTGSTAARYAARLAQTADAGCNLVRVWGGGIYEDDAFYDECDERGLLVWQDVLMACASYAEEEPLRSELLAEVRDNATRLAPHPSLVLWCGGNENLWGFVDWDWDVRLDGKTWGAGYVHDLLPGPARRARPGPAVRPGQPLLARRAGRSRRHGRGAPPQRPGPRGRCTSGTCGTTDDWTVYRDHRPRFASEFGWQGPPTWSTLVRAVSDDPLTPESPGMLVHQKATEGQRKLERGLVPHLRVPDDMRDWHWAMSLNQARAVRTAVEHLRSLSPVCAGSIVWQLNDCWPVTSWAAVDGDGRAKPTLHALRHAHADRLLTVQPRDGGLAAVLVNDSPRGRGRATLACGGSAWTARRWPPRTCRSTSPPARRATVPVPADVAAPDDGPAEVLVADAPGRPRLVDVRRGPRPRPGRRRRAGLGRARRRRLPGHASRRPPWSRTSACSSTSSTPTPPSTTCSLTLLPGEQAVFRVRCGELADPQALLRPDVLRSTNQLVAG